MTRRSSVGDVMRFDIAGQIARRARHQHSAGRVGRDAERRLLLRAAARAPSTARVPHTFVGFVETGGNAGRPAARSSATSSTRIPNVSSIDVRAILDSIRAVVDNVTLGVTIVGAVTLIGGILILVGAVAMTKFQRLYEAAIYRTLGASTRLVATMVAVEYGVLGLLAGVLGAAGALGLSWALARWLFEIDWRPAPALLSAGVLITAVAVSSSAWSRASTCWSGNRWRLCGPSDARRVHRQPQSGNGNGRDIGNRIEIGN